MSTWLIACTGLAYTWVAFEQFTKGNINLGGMYMGYALSNVFLWRMAHVG